MNKNDPNHLMRFTDLLRSAGYTRRFVDPDLKYFSPSLRGKEYALIEEDAVEKDVPHDLKYHYRLTLGEDRGYIGFYCEFYFDSNGNIIGHGAWE